MASDEMVDAMIEAHHNVLFANHSHDERFCSWTTFQKTVRLRAWQAAAEAAIRVGL